MEIDELLWIWDRKKLEEYCIHYAQMAVLAPIPSEIVRIETAVKTGDFASWRNV